MVRSNAPLQRALRFAGIFAIAAVVAVVVGLIWTDASMLLNVLAGVLMLVFAVIVIIGLARQGNATR